MATMWVQLDRFVTGWADNLFPLPDLSQFAVTEHETLISDGVSTSRLTVAILDDVTLALPGVDVLTLELLPGTYGPELTAEFDWTGPFAVRLLDLGANLVIASPLLVPVQGEPGAWVPQLNTDGSPAPVRASVQAGVVQIDGAGGITATLDNAISLGSFMIGDTGIVLEVSNARPSFAGTEPPPDTAVRGFRGLLFDSVTLHFPDGIELGGILPETIQVLDGAIGTGGFSGAFTGEWDVTWQGTTPSGDGAGTLLGFPFGLRSLQLQVQQDCVTTAVLAGSLAVPFFDQVLTVAVAIDSSGGFAVTVTGTPESPPALGYDTGTTLATPAVATLTLPGLGTLRVTSLGVVRDDQGDALVLSGDLSLTVGSPVLSWPTLTVQGLRIGADGSIALDGGWLDLQQPLALNLYGFGMELTRLGFGAEDDGRRWVGVDGALRLTSLLPAGASARGLRVIWDPLHPGALPELTLDGVGVSFGVPGAFGFDGSVALADDPDTGAKLFTGALGFGLDALEIGIDAGITIGRLAPDTYVFVHLGVDLPIPLAATGAALYGLEGLLAISMAPVVASGPWPPGQSPDQPPVVRKGDWYGWYKLVDTKFAASDPEKWSADPGAWALGAGLSIGTLPDAGFSVSTRALLVVLLPGPVLLLQGTADLFRVPPALGGSDQEGTLSLLAALDARAGTLQLGIDAAWRLGQLIDIAAATEAFFDFDRADAWHLWIGQDQPATARIQAGFLALFQADAWLMLGAKGVDTGLGVQWGDSWQFGPATVTLDTWVAGHAALSRRPPQIAGDLSVGGDASVALGPFDLGIDVEAELSGQSPTPYEVTGTVSVSVALPAPLKDLDVDLELSWQQPATPQVDDPWSDAIAGHSRTTESWRPIEGGSLGKGPSADAPVIPLDATVLLTFVKPMGDLTAVADNPPVPAPAETVGRYEATYALTGLRLHRQRRNRPREGWEDVTATVFGTWTPDAGDAGSRLQLLARSPFDFTRFTSRAWTDDFVRGQPDWPCLPEPAVSPVCTSWNDQPAGRVMPALWAQDGATFASQARLDVVEFEAGPLGTVRLLRLGPAEQDGRAVPGVLWVALPEPASRVSVAVDVLLDRIVLVRAWSGGEPVGLDATLPGPGVAEVSAAAIDAITIDWGFTREIELAAICWTPAAETDRSDAWTFRQQRLETAGQRWSSDEALLEPDSHYLLEVSTRALLTKGGTTVQQLDSTRTLEFQTGGPPGIVPAWDPPPAGTPAGGFPRGGVLADLASYVRRSIPDPAAAPVFRAYDLGCEFSSTAVQQLYGADLVITVQDDNGQPLRDPGGAPVVLANAWEPAPVTTLSVSDAAWLDRLGHCLGADSMAALRGDDVIRAELPSGVLLPPRRALTARLEATRPLFTDPFDSLDAFDPRVLGTGAPVTSCTAGGGAATITRPASGPAAVAALAGDPAEGDYTVECSAECAAVPRRAGTFGLVARYTSPGNYLALELTPGAGRRLAAYTSVAGRQAERVLWADHRAVEVGRTYALTLSCAGPRVTVSVDGEPFSVRAGPGHGRFGLLSAVPAPAGGVFRDLVVRSAPRQVVHQWRFTTSRYAGLPELAATFAGRTWPAAGAAAPDRATFSGAVAAGLAQLEPATAAAGAARDELAAAVAAGNVIDQPALAAAALAAVGGLQAASAGVFRELAQALGLPYAPAPPVLEILAVPDGDEVLALLLDLPEPLPWERMSWSLRQVRSGGHAAGQDVLLAWSEDGRQALLVDPDGSPLAGGPWLLRLTLALDVGAERAAWRRAGSTQAEHADLAFLL
jgi:hypothetical protein